MARGGARGAQGGPRGGPRGAWGPQERPSGSSGALRGSLGGPSGGPQISCRLPGASPRGPWEIDTAPEGLPRLPKEPQGLPEEHRTAPRGHQKWRVVFRKQVKTCCFYCFFIIWGSLGSQGDIRERLGSCGVALEAQVSPEEPQGGPKGAQGAPWGPQWSLRGGTWGPQGGGLGEPWGVPAPPVEFQFGVLCIPVNKPE